MKTRYIVALVAVLAVVYGQSEPAADEKALPQTLIAPVNRPTSRSDSQELQPVPSETQQRPKRAPILLGKALLGGAVLGAGALGAGAIGAGVLGAGALGLGLYKAK